MAGHDELLSESPLFGLDHARGAIVEWGDDHNHFRPHSPLGCQTPADYAGIIAATGSNATQGESFGLAPIAQAALFGVVEIAAVLVAAG